MESMGAAEYKPPLNVNDLLFDFYTIQLLDAEAKGTPSHRSDELEREVDYVKGILYPYLKEHFLAKVGYSIFSELGNTLRLNDVPTVRKILPRIVPESDLGIIAKMLVDSHDAASDEMGYEEFQKFRKDFPRIAGSIKKIFSDPELWQKEFYGGKPWANAVDSWMKLHNASSLREMQIWIDHIYDIQHNTGNVLDKNAAYNNGNFERALELKKSANSAGEILQYASPYVKKLAQQYLRSHAGISTDKAKSLWSGPHKEVNPKVHDLGHDDDQFFAGMNKQMASLPRKIAAVKSDRVSAPGKEMLMRDIKGEIARFLQSAAQSSQPIPYEWAIFRNQNGAFWPFWSISEKDFEKRFRQKRDPREEMSDIISLIQGEMTTPGNFHLNRYS